MKLINEFINSLINFKIHYGKDSMHTHFPPYRGSHFRISTR